MNSCNFDYSVNKSARAKRFSVSVYPDARVIVTVPKLMPERLILYYIKKYSTWIQTQLKKTTGAENCICLPAGRRDYLRNKEKTRLYVQQTLNKLNYIYGFSYNRIAIKNLYARWGSCSAKKNLNFNYKLIHLPEPLAEYIVAHELCHLGQLNHSKKFWALVAKTIPDYKDRRKQLKKYLL